MSTTIIAGRLQEQTEAAAIVDELQHAGFARECISAFFLNPQGQHDTYPIGGDRQESPGAHETGKGAAAGVAAGAAVGVAASPVLGPLGPVAGGLLGAHVGGLVGGVSQMKEKGETGAREGDAQNAKPQRKSGMLVAVAVAGQEQEEQAINVLRAAGATEIERAQGTIEQGDWRDFNPLASPELVENLPQRPSGGETGRRV